MSPVFCLPLFAFSLFLLGCSVTSGQRGVEAVDVNPTSLVTLNAWSSTEKPVLTAKLDRLALLIGKAGMFLAVLVVLLMAGTWVVQQFILNHRPWRFVAHEAASMLLLARQIVSLCMKSLEPC